jgi:hypothetical protein
MIAEGMAQRGQEKAHDATARFSRAQQKKTLVILQIEP